MFKTLLPEDEIFLFVLLLCVLLLQFTVLVLLLRAFNNAMLSSIMLLPLTVDGIATSSITVNSMVGGLE